jgi:plastocyanin
VYQYQPAHQAPSTDQEAVVKRLLAVLAIAAVVVPTAGVPSASAGGGGCHRDLHRDLRGVRVTMVDNDNCFDPTVVRIDPGQRVTWINASDQPHAVAGPGLKWGSYDEISVGKSTSHTFGKPGTYPYYCYIHPGMVGAVVVGNGIPADSSVQDAAGTKEGALVPPAASRAPADSPAPAAAPAAPAAQADPAANAGESDRGLAVAGVIALAALVLVVVIVALARRPASVTDLTAA